jgi:hypothetical protein
MLISEQERMKNDNINKNKIWHRAVRSKEKHLTRGKRAQKIQK